MKQPAFLQHFLKCSFVFAFLWITSPSFAAQTPQDNGETIVLVRHGEKPANGLGQLSCKGLNRSLALPSLLIGRYGKPDFIYAPDPSVQLYDNRDHTGPMYSYVRPLATIEPTAIRSELSVNTQIGFDQIDALQRELLQPAYAHSLIFVAWEHIKSYEFAKQVLQSYGISPAQLPDWPNDDYETIYVFHIMRTGKGSAPRATLEIQKEDLGNTLNNACPGPRS
jgi:hypothetical protein